MRTKDEVINLIDKNTFTIIENISRESIDVYNFLNDQFANTKITENYLFQFVYRSFYRIDNAGLTSNFKSEYFKLLEEYRNKNNFEFSTILNHLYLITNHQGQNTFQFSFVSKMQSTLNNNKPIYDSEVARVFSFSRPKYNLSFEDKLRSYSEQLTLIEQTYKSFIENQSLTTIINLFDDKFPDHGLNEIKKLDFIFWSTGKVIR